jgi:hypothetical protein
MTTQTVAKPAPQVKLTIYLPEELADRIESEVSDWNSAHPKSPETRSDRIAYLLQYAYDAGQLNQFVDLMKSQYLEILSSTPQQLAQGVATYTQADLINYRLNDIDDKLQELSVMLQK